MTPMFANTGIPMGLVFVVIVVPWIAAFILAIANFVLIIRYASGNRGWHCAVLGACAMAIFGVFMYLNANPDGKNAASDLVLFLVPPAVIVQFVWLLRMRRRVKART